ncbi:unnamed protein product [Bursaphelenchus xylophilus]|uniref:(pine wood nematode) hypothetical protein n=1 Tax=Bursaphelenchus xylophilus TaxID=6326 RepID=A0A1I7S9U5_BURXY|nr:unnamed protein product [Bursaphelenchus xylophilus]CAG9129249.1 unnamed protein product [Bursaphelenchus xylophilus]
MLDYLLPFMRLDHHPEFVRVRIRTRFFPILTVITAVLAFFTGYGLAVGQGRTQWNLPYISDGGTFPPESCIFGILLSMSGFFWICTVFAMHIRLNTHLRTTNNDELPFYYKIIFLFMMSIGLTSGVGVLLVACVQETNVNVFHLIGAMMAFCCGLFYLWVLLFLTLIVKPSFSSVRIMIIRGLIIFIASCAFLLAVTNNLPGSYNQSLYNATLTPGRGHIVQVPWDSELHGWHLMNTYCEWVIALSFVTLILTMTFELGPYELHSHRLMKMANSGSLPTQEPPQPTGVLVNDGTQTTSAPELMNQPNGQNLAGQSALEQGQQPVQTPGQGQPQLQRQPLINAGVQTEFVAPKSENDLQQASGTPILPAASTPIPIQNANDQNLGVRPPIRPGEKDEPSQPEANNSQGFRTTPVLAGSAPVTPAKTPKMGTAKTPEPTSNRVQRRRKDSKKSNREEYIQPSKGRVIYMDTATNTPRDVAVQTTPDASSRKRKD